MTKNAIGIVELSSIAAGYATSDAMLKAANVNMLLTRSICSGKFMVMVGGDVAGVQAAVDAGIAISEGAVIDSAVLSNIDKSVFPAISGATTVDELEALGVIESFSVTSLIQAADAAVKALALAHGKVSVSHIGTRIAHDHEVAANLMDRGFAKGYKGFTLSTTPDTSRRRP